MQETKIKITEIPLKGKTWRWQVNEKGERVKVEKEITTFKEVDCVSGWLRFGHYIIDYILYYAFSYVVGYLFGLSLYYTGLSENMSPIEVQIYAVLFGLIVVHPGFYFFWEYFFQKTPGKWVTQCRVVDEYGERPAFKQILRRSYARSIPFEIFSCLSERGWHDTMSNTYLLKESTLQELKAIMMIDEIGKPVDNGPDETMRPNSFSSE